MAAFEEMCGELFHACLPCLRAELPQVCCFGINGGGAPKHLIHRCGPLRDRDCVRGMQAELLFGVCDRRLVGRRRSGVARLPLPRRRKTATSSWPTPTSRSQERRTGSGPNPQSGDPVRRPQPRRVCVLGLPGRDRCPLVEVTHVLASRYAAAPSPKNVNPSVRFEQGRRCDGDGRSPCQPRRRGRRWRRAALQNACAPPGTRQGEWPNG